MRIVTLPLLVAAPLALGACTSEPTFGERIVSEGAAYAAVGQQWIEGQQMAERGADLIEEGEDLIEEGEDDVAEGRRLLRRGQALMAEAEQTYRNSQVAAR